MCCYFPRSEILYQKLFPVVNCQEGDEKKQEILKVVSEAFGEQIMDARCVDWWVKFVLLDSKKLPSVRFYNKNKRTIVKVLMAYKYDSKSARL